MAVSFRCKASGNIITFEHAVDIDTTRTNDAYEEVIQEEEPIVEKKQTKKAPKGE